MKSLLRIAPVAIVAMLLGKYFDLGNHVLTITVSLIIIIIVTIVIGYVSWRNTKNTIQ